MLPNVLLSFNEFNATTLGFQYIEILIVHMSKTSMP